MIDLTGKTALVTGASRGIGEAIARSLDAAGAQVLLNSRREEDVAAVAADLTNDPQLYAADLEPSGAGTALAERVVAMRTDIRAGMDPQEAYLKHGKL